MGLKAKVASLDGVAEADRKWYVQDGEEYVLDVDKYTEHLNSRVSEFRTNNINLMRLKDELESKLQPFDGLSADDVTELKTLREEQQKAKDKKMIEEGKVEELLAERTDNMRKAFEAKIKALEGANADLTSQLGTVTMDLDTRIIQDEILGAVDVVGVLKKNARPYLLQRARQDWQRQDGQLVAIDPSTKSPRYGKNGRDPLSPAEWAEGMIDEAPFLFEGIKGGGAGGDGGNNGSGGAVKRINMDDPKAFGANLEGVAKGTVVAVRNKQ